MPVTETAHAIIALRHPACPMMRIFFDTAEFLGIPVIAVTGIDKPMLSYAVDVVP